MSVPLAKWLVNPHYIRWHPSFDTRGLANRLLRYMCISCLSPDDPGNETAHTSRRRNRSRMRAPTRRLLAMMVAVEGTPPEVGMKLPSVT